MKIIEKFCLNLLKKLKNFSRNNGLGPNYSEYSGAGQLAVKHLCEMECGQVKGAFFKYELRDKTGIGELDIAWGKVTDPKLHKGYGIAHILDKHGQKAVDMIGEIVENGSVYDASNNKLQIKYKDYVLIIRKELFGEKRNLVISCFDKTKESPQSKTNREKRKKRK